MDSETFTIASGNYQRLSMVAEGFQMWIKGQGGTATLNGVSSPMSSTDRDASTDQKHSITIEARWPRGCNEVRGRISALTSKYN